MSLAPALRTSVRAEDETEGLSAAPNRQVRRLPVIGGPGGDRTEPPVAAEPLLRGVDAAFQRLDAAIARVLPERLNPFAQTGAIANTTFLVAAVSGVVLLIWYRTSVHQAYDSVAAMGAEPWLSGLVRSLHRHSSDACMFFVLVHALKLFSARRFGGARWLAWITGVVLVGTLWFVGWTGYWLVWDERAQRVATGTGRMLDVLPIFADPLSRSFLTDEGVNSLLFFAVFFVHMLMPLAMGIALWLHITRLSRPHFLTRRAMTAWVVLTLVAMSVIWPADHATRANMTEQPSGGVADVWYLAPLWLTDRLGGGALWALFLVLSTLLLSVPWLLARRRARPAAVEVSRCNACEKCSIDCPYDAISMEPRTDGKPFATEARVDPNKCVGCGICAGSCDSAGVGVWWFSEIEQRRQLDRRIESALKGGGGAPRLVLGCEESAAATLPLDAEGKSRELDDVLVLRVPCAGWVHPLTVERALRRGAREVVVVGCGPGSCRYREGMRWTEERMTGAREPHLRSDKVPEGSVRVLALFRYQGERLRSALRGGEASQPAPPSGGRRWGLGLALALSLALMTWAVTRVTVAAPRTSPELVVSFKHPGQVAEQCRTPTAEDLEGLPPHMRPKQLCERRRADVRLRVELDEREVVHRSFEPRGLWNDGNSIAVVRVPLPVGKHHVRVAIGDSPASSSWQHVDERVVEAQPGRTNVVVFDKMNGFSWYPH